MLLCSWNLRHGASRNAEDVLGGLIAYRPDVAVLTEYRRTPSTAIRQGLVREGYTVLDDTALEKQNSVCLAVRHPVRRVPRFTPDLLDNHWIEAELAGVGLRVAGVYLPTKGKVGLEAKRRFWRAIHEVATECSELPMIMIGDWNTGDNPLDSASHREFSCVTEYRRMRTLGFSEAWREHNPTETEYTWYSSKRSGRRLDHAFVSSALLSRVKEVRYSHREREAGLSDHSVMLVRLDLQAAAELATATVRRDLQGSHHSSTP